MASIIAPLTITRATRQKIRVEIDRFGFERLADSLGLYRPEFLESLEHAEADIKAGRVKKLRSLRDLRRRS